MGLGKTASTLVNSPGSASTQNQVSHRRTGLLFLQPVQDRSRTSSHDNDCWAGRHFFPSTYTTSSVSRSIVIGLSTS